MKIKKLLKKTLLVAAGLLVGSSAWADVILFTAPTDNGDGTYTLNGSTYTKTTYDFTNTVPAQGDGTSKNTQENQTMGGYTDDPVTRSYVQFSNPVSEVYPGLTFAKTENSFKTLYYYEGKGLRTDGGTTLTITAQSERTLAVLHYTTGDGTTTVAEGTKHTIAKRGANLSFSLGDKNTSPYYIYTSLDVYEEISVGNFVYDSTTGYYKKDGANYIRSTYDFTENKGYGTTNGNSVAGFSNTGITRYNLSSTISSATTAYYDGELTFTPSKPTKFYWCIGYGMQFDQTVYLKPTTADSYTVAYLYYKQGDADGTYAAEEVAESCESITGSSSKFTLYQKNDPRYLYTTMVVFQEVGIGDFYSGGDGCYYIYSDLASKTTPYYRTTYDFTTYRYYTNGNNGKSGAPSGFSDAEAKIKFQSTLGNNSSISTSPTGLTFTNNSGDDAYLQYYANMGMQAGTGALILSVTNATANTVSYLYYKQGDEDKTNTVAAASEESTPITISGTASVELPVKTTSYKLYTRLEVFTKDVSKTISAAGWATYCSPYPLDFSGDIENLTDVYIITGSQTPGAESGYVAKTSVKGGTVPANTGLLIKGSAGTVTIPVAASSSTNVDDNKLVGVTTETVLDLDSNDDDIADQSVYVLMGSPKLGFYQTTTTSFTLGANTAYLPANFAGSSEARFFSLFNDDVTGISDATRLNDNEKMINDNCFDLQGRRVAQPTKGLYIVNGKKVVIK